MIKKLLTLFVVLGITAFEASAGTITFEQTITLSDNNTFPPPVPTPTLPLISLVLPYNINLPQFDPSIGTLTGVSINATTVSQSATLDLTNNSNSQLSVGLVGDNGRAIFDLPGFVANFVISNDRPNSTVQVGGNSTESIDITPFPIELVNAIPNDFTPYIGTGNFNGQVNASRSMQFLPSGQFMATASGAATARFSVTYTYVPEPNSLVLIGLGLSGFALACSRRLPGRQRASQNSFQ